MDMIGMETVYLDPISYHCHRESDSARIPFETDFFIGKCDEFVEGYFAIPNGHTLTMQDGKVLSGIMIAPWKPYSELDAAQREHERELAQAARILLGEVSE